MKRILIACFSLCLFTQSWASLSSTQYDNANDNHVYLGGAVGAIFPNVSDSNRIPTGTGWPNDYYGSQSISNQPSFYLSGGYTWARPSDWLPFYGLGLRYMYVPGTTTKGYINQYSLPAFRNYNYQYDIQLLNVLATFKVDLVRWRQIMPYLLAGAGISNYGTSNYKEIATVGVTPRVSPGYGDNSGTNFAYLLGVGLDYIATDALWFNLEYDHYNFGTIQTGNGANTSMLTGFNFSNSSLKNSITANAAFLGVTYNVG